MVLIYRAFPVTFVRGRPSLASCRLAILRCELRRRAARHDEAETAQA